MPKLMIETNTIENKVKVKKWLQDNKITYVKNDIGDENYTFYFEHDTKIVTIPDAEHTVKVIKSVTSPEEADKETVPMKQPEADNVEAEIEPAHDYTNLKLMGFIGGIFALIVLYVMVN